MSRFIGENNWQHRNLEVDIGGILSGAGNLVGNLADASRDTPGTVVVTDEDQLTTTEQTQEVTGTTSIEELLQELQSIQESISQQSAETTAQQQQTDVTGTQVVQNLTAEERANLNTQIQQITDQLGGESPFSPEAAAIAGQEAVTAAIQQVLQSGIAEVAQQGTNFGAFGGTAQARQAQELGAQAVQAGAATELQNIQTFGQLENQRQANLANQLTQLLSTLTQAGSITETQQQEAVAGTTETAGSTVTDRTQEQTTEQQRDVEQEQDQTTQTTGTTETEITRDPTEVGREEDPLSRAGSTLGNILGGGGGLVAGLTGGLGGLF